MCNYIVPPKTSWAGLCVVLTNTTATNDCQTPSGQISWARMLRRERH